MGLNMVEDYLSNWTIREVIYILVLNPALFYLFESFTGTNPNPEEDMENPIQGLDPTLEPFNQT